MLLHDQNDAFENDHYSDDDFGGICWRAFPTAAAMEEPSSNTAQLESGHGCKKSSLDVPPDEES